MKRIIVKNLIKDFRIGSVKRQSALQRFVTLFSGVESKKTIRVLDDVSLEVCESEILGIMGDNGSGKSTLLRLIAGILKEDSGQIITNGKIISLINLYASLKDRLTMKDNIFLIGAFFGLGSREIKLKLNEIVKFAGLGQFLDTKVYQFSEGMKQRLVFSVASHSRPDILLLDEIFEVGDHDFKEKSGNRIKELVSEGVSVVLVSHSTEILKKYCDTIVELSCGKITGAVI